MSRKLVDREVGSPRGGRSTHLLCDRLTLLPISMLNRWCLSQLVAFYRQRPFELVAFHRRRCRPS